MVVVRELKSGFAAEFPGLVHLVGGAPVEIKVGTPHIRRDIRHGEVLHLSGLQLIDCLADITALHVGRVLPIACNQRRFHVARYSIQAILPDKRQQGEEVGASGPFNLFVPDIGNRFDDAFRFLHQDVPNRVNLNANRAGGLGEGKRRPGEKGQG